MGYSQLFQLKDNTLNDGLVVHYPFSGNANDISGNNYNGTVVGATPTTNRFGIVNSAYNFDGVNDYINIPHNLIFNSLPISFTFWIKFTNAQSNQAGIINKYIAGSSNGYNIYIISNNIACWYYQNSSNYIQGNFLNKVLNDGKYHFCYIEFTTTGSKIIVDCQNIKKQSWNGTASVTTTTTPITIGKYSTSYYEDFIDDIRIYNRALSTSEIKALYRERPETNYFAEFVQANGYEVTTGGNITGWLTNELTGCRVEQLGSAAVSIVDNSYISYTSGTLFGIKIYDSSDNLIHELACCENNVNVPYLHCSVTGRIFYITNVKTVIKQDTYFKCKDNGWQQVTITESGDVMDVAYKNDKTRIYN
jgi:hypothetical protein